MSGETKPKHSIGKWTGGVMESWMAAPSEKNSRSRGLLSRNWALDFLIREAIFSLMNGPLEQQLETFLRAQPQLGQGVYVARGATILGDVRLGDYSSVWFNAVLRGDINRIVIGHHSNIQDNSVLHLADDFACVLGNYVTVGHNAIVHACTVEDEVLVGMGSVILDGATIGAQSVIGAGALVPQGAQIPPGSMVLGVPGKVVRSLSPKERAELKGWAEKYVGVAAYYLKHRINLATEFCR